MIKVRVDSVSVSNGEVSKFSILDDARGTVGSFVLVETDESKYGAYAVGSVRSLIFGDDIVLLNAPVVETPTVPEQAPSIINKVKNLFTGNNA